jgi:hypothetical protein
MKTDYSRQQKEKQKRTGIFAYISIISVHLNGLNSPIKRHKIAEWIFLKTQQYAPKRSSPYL